MDILRTHAIFFSAAGTTRQITEAIATGIGNPDIRFHDLLLQAPKEAVTIPAYETALFVMPVYAGRIPQPATKALEQIHGEKTPAFIACVYGNRHYDDALRELRDRVEKQGFSVISAGLFIAQHSIFPRVAAGRPDAADLAEAKQFGKESRQWLSTHPEWATSPRIDVPGNYPYRPTMNPPLKPKTNRHCNGCGICAAQCPAGAIDKENPRHLDPGKCLSCAHCIAVCPQRAKHFGGLVYRLAARKFFKKFATPQKNHCIYRLK